MLTFEKTPEAVIENMEAIKPEADRQYKFIRVNKQDADSAFKRMRLLKQSKENLRKDINETNCANMSDDLMRAYDDLMKMYKYIISLESEMAKIGE